MKTIYSVISLPRTGTLSISKMAKIVGLRPNHIPLWSLDYYITSEEYNFFSDTPMYDPTIVKQLCNNPDLDLRFIYIEKEAIKIYESWEKVNLLYSYNFFLNQPVDNLKPGQLFDKQTYFNTFGGILNTKEEYLEAFEIHKKTVLNIVQEHNKPLLVYDFKQGWEPFCSFVQCDIPKVEIPHLNVNTMFDPLN